jgi:probable metal-binding protein
MTHGHEVLEMMQGHTYTEKSLLEAILEKFGPEERFCTCSADNLTAQGLIDFLKERGKFMPAEDGFTVDGSKVCNH